MPVPQSKLPGLRFCSRTNCSCMCNCYISMNRLRGEGGERPSQEGCHKCCSKNIRYATDYPLTTVSCWSDMTTTTPNLPSSNAFPSSRIYVLLICIVYVNFRQILHTSPQPLQGKGTSSCSIGDSGYAAGDSILNGGYESEWRKCSKARKVSVTTPGAAPAIYYCQAI
jgi:hypothetical protein